MRFLDQGATEIAGQLRWLGTSTAAPVVRVALALPFLRSGLTRWTGFFELSPVTTFLFQEQFQLHLFGSTYGLPLPATLAWIVAIAELVLPALLLLGLGTRLAALGLLLMTGVIQLVFPDGWANFHLYWAALSLSLLALGPGAMSMDHLLSRALHARTSRGISHV